MPTNKQVQLGQKQRELQTLIHLEGSLADQYRQLTVRKKLAAGYTVFYLPLMSSYKIKAQLANSAQTSLNQLLLTWEAGGESGKNPLAQVFGRCDQSLFAPYIKGQVDDLVSLSNHILRKLLLSFVELVKLYPPPVYALIDCDGLAWDQIIISASLSDSLCFDPPSLGFAAQESQKAIHKLLGQVPPQLKLFKISPDFKQTAPSNFSDFEPKLKYGS